MNDSPALSALHCQWPTCLGFVPSSVTSGYDRSPLILGVWIAIHACVGGGALEEHLSPWTYLVLRHCLSKCLWIFLHCGSDICVVGSRVFGEAIEVPLLGKSLVEICLGSHVLPQGWQKLESVNRGREFPREIQLLIEACHREVNQALQRREHGLGIRCALSLN